MADLRRRRPDPGRPVPGGVRRGMRPRSVALYEKVLGSPPTTDHGSATRTGRSATGWTPCSSSTHLALPPWVDAFAEEFSNIYYLDPQRREATIASWRGESQKHVRFFVALYVRTRRERLEKPETCGACGW